MIMDNKVFSAIWLFALCFVMVLNNSTSTSLTFVGSTSARAVNVSLEHPATIKKINVISGQNVQKGQLLLELDSPELNLKINTVSHELDQLKAEYEINKQLKGQLLSIKSKKNEGTQEDPEQINIAKLEKELKLLYEEKNKLYIFSTFDGVVGDIYYQSGETISPFTPVLQMHEHVPTSIRGYIHENNYHQVRIGQSVEVRSYSNEAKIYKAAVASVGSKIVEIPARFKKNPEIALYGREVIIKLPIENNFLLGEKVLITAIESSSESPFSAVAAERSISRDQSSQALKTIKKPASWLDIDVFEPSGAVYIDDMQKLLIVSDDTPKDKPVVYLMDTSGNLDNHLVEIKGIKKFEDMESISLGQNGDLYIASSSSETKKGKHPKARRKLVKVTRQGLELEAVGSIDLYKIIKEYIKKHDHNDCSFHLSDNKKKLKIDIEGIAYSNGDLFIGLRRPQTANNELLILKIDNIDELFTTEELAHQQLNVWRKIKLPSNNKHDMEEGISDLLVVGRDLYIATANNSSEIRGRVFKTSLDHNQISEIKTFKNNKPEGIAYDSHLNSLVIFFDNNIDFAEKFYQIKL